MLLLTERSLSIQGKNNLGTFGFEIATLIQHLPTKTHRDALFMTKRKKKRREAMVMHKHPQATLNCKANALFRLVSQGMKRQQHCSIRMRLCLKVVQFKAPTDAKRES